LSFFKENCKSSNNQLKFEVDTPIFGTFALIFGLLVTGLTCPACPANQHLVNSTTCICFQGTRIHAFMHLHWIQWQFRISSPSAAKRNLRDYLSSAPLEPFELTQKRNPEIYPQYPCFEFEVELNLKK